MSLPTAITALKSPSHPSQTLTGFSKLRWAVKTPPIDPAVSFAHKTILVTGANTGLGFEAALKYAQKGCATLILAVRALEKGEAAKTQIIQRSGRSEGDGLVVKVMRLDMADFSSIKSFVHELTHEVQHLDIALLNAGLANPTFIHSPSGYEESLQVNVLGTALLAHLLVPLLHKPAQVNDPPHLTFVNSVAHAAVQRSWYSPFNNSLFAFANSRELFDQRKSYAAVKLLGLAVMLHFHNSPLTCNIIVNACCPFFCRTDLGRKFAKPAKMMFGAWQYFTARSAEEGSRTLVGATVLGRESGGEMWHCDVLYP